MRLSGLSFEPMRLSGFIFFPIAFFILSKEGFRNLDAREGACFARGIFLRLGFFVESLVGPASILNFGLSSFCGGVAGV
tara:strand:- start:178 stop:414 length:237 start_codon:yes stop_codon:yes gene_type:complete